MRQRRFAGGFLSLQVSFNRDAGSAGCYYHQRADVDGAGAAEAHN
jgi:hypothetical protein